MQICTGAELLIREVSEATDLRTAAKLRKAMTDAANMSTALQHRYLFADDVGSDHLLAQLKIVGEDLYRRCCVIADRVKVAETKPTESAPAAVPTNWTRAATLKEVADLLGMNKRTLKADTTIKREQLTPPNGKFYRFDLDAISDRKPSAAAELDPDGK